MKRFAIILLAVATALVMALPATAKKPVEPEPVPSEYDVEIVVVGDEGIATAEPCGGSARVVRDGAHFQSWDGVELDVSAPGLEWDDTSITGCHGLGLVEFYDIDGVLTESSATEQPAPGYFRITLEDDGSVAMMWIFDVYQSEAIVKELKKRTLWDITERTDFRMGGPYDENGDFVIVPGLWDDDGGVIAFTVTGQFNFVVFTRGGDPVFEHLTSGAQVFTLDITLRPVT